jgi:hypothetical protein
MNAVNRLKHGVWVVVLVPCCVSVLDLDSYDDAITALCKCDMDVPQFDGACVDVLKNRLDGVSEPSRQKWLTFYAEQCQGKCTNAFSCFQNVGTCAQRSCTEDRECCDYSEDTGMRCIDDECAMCRPLGAECSSEAQCCDQDALCLGGVCDFEVSSSVSVGSGGAMSGMTPP